MAHTKTQRKGPRKGGNKAKIWPARKPRGAAKPHWRPSRFFWGLYKGQDCRNDPKPKTPEPEKCIFINTMFDKDG